MTSSFTYRPMAGEVVELKFDGRKVIDDVSDD